MIDETPHRKQDTEIFLMNNWYKKATTSYIHLDLQNFSTQTCKPELLENIEPLCIIIYKANNHIDRLP